VDTLGPPRLTVRCIGEALNEGGVGVAPIIARNQKQRVLAHLAIYMGPETGVGGRTMPDECDMHGWRGLPQARRSSSSDDDARQAVMKSWPSRFAYALQETPPRAVL